MNSLLNQWRRKLTDADFSEASNFSNNFFKQDTLLTAFFVNLYPSDSCVNIYYGYASTAFTRMSGCENSLSEYGISDMENCVRFHASLCVDEDDTLLAESISEVFRRYRGMQKDDLLAEVKEKRKAFLSRITQILKPLGFRKKGNEWHKNLSPEHIIYFKAEKSTYSDTYNFHVAISALNNISYNRYYCTIAALEPPQNIVSEYLRQCSHHRFDWQLNSPEELAELLQQFIDLYVKPAQNGMDTLGSEEYIWNGCLCDLDCCEHCWVEKNQKMMTQIQHALLI